MKFLFLIFVTLCLDNLSFASEICFFFGRNSLLQTPTPTIPTVTLSSNSANHAEYQVSLEEFSQLARILGLSFFVNIQRVSTTRYATNFSSAMLFFLIHCVVNAKDIPETINWEKLTKEAQQLGLQIDRQRPDLERF